MHSQEKKGKRSVPHSHPSNVPEGENDINLIRLQAISVPHGTSTHFLQQQFAQTKRRPVVGATAGDLAVVVVVVVVVVVGRGPVVGATLGVPGVDCVFCAAFGAGVVVVVVVVVVEVGALAVGAEAGGVPPVPVEVPCTHDMGLRLQACTRVLSHPHACRTCTPRHAALNSLFRMWRD